MKSTITREESVQAVFDLKVGYRLGFADIEILKRVARMALAAMDSEPVTHTEDELNAALQLHRLKVEGHSQLSDAFRAGFRYARRTAPQLSPVVTDIDELRLAFEAAERESDDGFNLHKYGICYADDKTQGRWEMWLACRAAMLQAEPVTTANKLGNSPAQSPIDHGYRKGCECSGCKTTVRICAERAGNSPVIGIDPASGPDRTVEVRYVAPPGYVMVPKEPTESMINAWLSEVANWRGHVAGYKAMLAAAQHDTPALNPVQSVLSVQGWIPVSERLPEEGGRYWCYVEEQNSLGKSHYQWNCSWNGEIWGGAMMHGRVTHWMPLPAAPQEVKGE